MAKDSPPLLKNEEKERGKTCEKRENEMERGLFCTREKRGVGEKRRGREKVRGRGG